MTTPSTNFPATIPHEDSTRVPASISASAVTIELVDKLHESVQQTLAPLDEFLRRVVPDLTVTSGRTAGSGFLLFTHRTYSSLRHPSVDPVVVGMTFTSLPNGVSIEADASGEETGDIVVSLPPPAGALPVSALGEAAASLAKQSLTAKARIAIAIADPARQSR